MLANNILHALTMAAGQTSDVVSSCEFSNDQSKSVTRFVCSLISCTRMQSRCYMGTLKGHRCLHLQAGSSQPAPAMLLTNARTYMHDGRLL